ncbi:NfeD family protein [Methanopyrus sp.]
MSQELYLLLVGVGVGTIALDCALNTGVVTAVGVACAWAGAYLLGTEYLIAAIPSGALILLIQAVAVLRRGRVKEDALPKDIEELKGEEGIVIREDPPLVKVCGEPWRAISKTELRRGEVVTILDVKDNKLVVEPKGTGERR